jgi:uncharacterized protein
MSADAIPIYRDEDFYVPAFQLKLRGRLADPEVIHDVVQVTYKDDLTKVDSFDITVNNWDAETRTFRYSDGDRFNPGQEVELSMGYLDRGRFRRMITGEITSLRPTFPAGGAPSLVVSGLNLLHRLRAKPETRVYEKVTDAAVAKQVAGFLGVRIEVGGTRNDEYEYLFQDNQFDVVFLLERARRIGYDLFVKEGGARGGKPTLYFGPSVGVRETTYKLTYGRSMIEFQPTLTTANQVGEVVVRGWDHVRKQKIEARATRRELDTKGLGGRGGQAAIEPAFNQRKEVVNVPVHTAAEAKRVAKETLERIAKDMIKATGSTVGLPDLRAGTVLQVDGLGTRFSGRYFVTATTHTIGNNGYVTSFECRREELS